MNEMNLNSRNKAIKLFETKINNLDPVAVEIIHQAALDLKESWDDEFFKDLMTNKSKLSKILKTYVPGKWRLDPYGVVYNGTFFYVSEICRIILGEEWYSD